MRLVSFLMEGWGWPLVRGGQRLSLLAPLGTWLAYGEYFVWAPLSVFWPWVEGWQGPAVVQGLGKGEGRGVLLFPPARWSIVAPLVQAPWDSSGSFLHVSPTPEQ